MVPVAGTIAGIALGSIGGGFFGEKLIPAIGRILGLTSDVTEQMQDQERIGQALYDLWTKIGLNLQRIEFPTVSDISMGETSQAVQPAFLDTQVRELISMRDAKNKASGLQAQAERLQEIFDVPTGTTRGGIASAGIRRALSEIVDKNTAMLAGMPDIEGMTKGDIRARIVQLNTEASDLLRGNRNCRHAKKRNYKRFCNIFADASP